MRATHSFAHYARAIHLLAATAGAARSGNDAGMVRLLTEIENMAQVLPNLQQQLEALQAENAKLQAAVNAKRSATVSWKVGRKGNIVFHGFGRFPISMYLSQYQRLVAVMPQIDAWIAANPKTTYTKDEYGPAETVSLSVKD